jgi:hypothetical protein
MADESLMTAPPPAPAAPAPPAAAPVAAPVAAPAPLAGAPAPTAAPVPASAAAAPAPAAPPAVAAPPAAPESYTFTAPEGHELDSATADAFAGVAKELGLTQDAAQKVVDKMAPHLAQRQAEQIKAVHEQWREQSTADKEFGGDKLAENLGLAKKAMDTFASPELKALMNQTGLGNHPEVIRMFVKAGKAISEDSFVAGKAAPPASGDARRLYTASNMNP